MGFFVFKGIAACTILADAGKNPAVWECFTEPLAHEAFYTKTTIGRMKAYGFFSWEYIVDGYKTWSYKCKYVLPYEYWDQSMGVWAQTEVEAFAAFQNWFLQKYLYKTFLLLIKLVVLLIINEDDDDTY